MTDWHRVLWGTLVAILSSWACGETLPRITPRAAYAQIARSGELRAQQIDGDLDVAKFRPPPGAKRIVLSHVHVEGQLHTHGDGPPVALHITDQSRLRNIDLRQSHWKAALTIENSEIQDRAWFDSAQFDAEFMLHANKIYGQAQFRSTRFNAPVQITASRFEPRAALRSSVSFTDARFTAPARFDRSHFANGVRFDTSRFDADAAFIGLSVPARASWRNVIFGGDAEFRFCHLGDADFGDAEQMSVFTHLADFRGCKMTSLRLDYADARGDLLLVNVQVSPGDVSLQQTSLRGAQNDFRGLQVAGKLKLAGAHLSNLQFDWFDISAPLLRSAPGSDVLRPLQQRLEELKKDEEAREASAVLAERVISERLSQPGTSSGDRAMAWTERYIWGKTTGYGTRLGRILVVALVCWLLFALPLLWTRRVRIRPMLAMPEKRPSLHEAISADALMTPPASSLTRVWHILTYAFGLMFTQPDLRLRPMAPITGLWSAYLLVMRGTGLALLALIALTLTKVSPIIQAILGKIVH